MQTFLVLASVQFKRFARRVLIQPRRVADAIGKCLNAEECTDEEKLISFRFRKIQINKHRITCIFNLTNMYFNMIIFLFNFRFYILVFCVILQGKNLPDLNI